MGPYAVSSGADTDRVAGQALGEFRRVDAGPGRVEEHHVGVDAVMGEPEAGDVRQAPGQPRRVGVVVGQAIDVVLEGVDPGGGPASSISI